MKVKVRKKDFLYICSLVVIFMQYAGIIDLNYYVQFIVAGLWIGYDALNVLANRGLKKNNNEEIIFFKKLFWVPWIVIFIYTMFLYFSGHSENVPLKTFIICNITIQINILFAFVGLRLFKERTLKNSIIALLIVMGAVTINAIIQRGPLIFFKIFYQIFTTLNSDNNPFEIADCTFASGLVFLVYVFYGRKKTKKETKYLILMGFIILLGFKRIQMLAIAMVIMVGFSLRVVKYRTSKNVLMNLFSIVIILISSGYIYLIQQDSFINSWTGLDMGRRKLYLLMNDYYDFGISYLGHGYGFSNKFAEINTNFPIIALHSDILRMFIELGFVGFYIWIIYYLYSARKRVEKIYGVDFAQKYFFMTIYLMVSYFTDNTINYFVTQYFYCILIPAILMNSSYFSKTE